MKNSLITLVLLLFCLGTFAQEKPVAMILYNFRHLNDTTQPTNFQKDEVVTYLGKEGSYFSSYSSERMAQDIKRMKEAPGFDGRINITKSGTIFSESYLIEPQKEKIATIIRLAVDNFVLNDTYPKQNWQIEDETKEIGGYHCQKATTSFRGRNYIAWFTTELPFPYGPWKLHGLPGLILSAQDEKAQVVFEFAAFDKVQEDNKAIIGLPEEAIPSTAEEVEKLRKAFIANPQAYYNSRTNARGNALKVITGKPNPASGITSINIQGDVNYKPSSITNNPIELSK